MKRFFSWLLDLLKQDPPLQKGGVGFNKVNPELEKWLKSLQPVDVLIHRKGVYTPTRPPKNPIPPSER